MLNIDRHRHDIWNVCTYVMLLINLMTVLGSTMGGIEFRVCPSDLAECSRVDFSILLGRYMLGDPRKCEKNFVPDRPSPPDPHMLAY